MFLLGYRTARRQALHRVHGKDDTRVCFIFPTGLKIRGILIMSDSLLGLPNQHEGIVIGVKKWSRDNFASVTRAVKVP